MINEEIKMLIRLVIFTTLTYTSSIARADCTENPISPKIACAKEGDLLAHQGNRKGAIESWNKSCQLGMHYSCRMSKKYNSNPEHLFKDFSSSPDFYKCENSKLSNQKCFNIASQTLNNTPTPAVNILHALCKKNFTKACFKLGEYYYDNNDYASAELLYKRSCEIGLSTGCSMLSRVASYIARDNNRDILRKLATVERRQKKRDKIDSYYRLKSSDNIFEVIENGILYNEFNELF